MTLLSMSLNAQRLPANKLGGFNFNPTGMAYKHAPTGQLRMPTLASDEYLFGPYTTDDFDATGISYGGYYTSAQEVTALVQLPSSEYASHLGDTIIGFRFALAGSTATRVYNFMAWPGNDEYWDQSAYRHTWELGAIGHNTGGTPTTVTTTTDVTFTVASSSTNTLTNNGVTITSSDTQLGGYNYMYLTQTNTISTNDGTITKIVINGRTDGSYPVSRLSATPGSYTVSNNVGTWTGNASSVTFTTGGTGSSYEAGCSSIVVTVERTTTGEGGTIEVGSNATTNGYLPAYGYMQDTGYKNQMIYTSNQLGLASGAQITSITFYPENGTGIPFYGSTVTMSLGNTTTSAFSGYKITPSDLTAVASKRITSADANATAWTFTFDTPFTYTGGNLLVQVSCPGYNNDGTSGQWARGYFYGNNQSTNVSIYSSGSSASGTSGINSTFLPRATFGYIGSTDIPEYLELAGGQWHDYFLDEPVVFEVSGDTITDLYIGYTYYQLASTSHAPQAVNSNSTGHGHMSYMYAYNGSSYEQGWWNDGTSGSGNTDRPGDLAVQLIFRSAKQKTDAPTISYTQDAAYYYITATAPASDPNAEVTLTVGGQTATGNGSVTIPVGRGENNQTVTATATAQAEGKLVSDPTTQTITVEASPLTPTPTPSVASQVLDATVQVTGSGEGTVHMYIDGQEVTNPYYLERAIEEYTVTVTVTAQIQDGDHSMSSYTTTVVVPPVNFNPEAGGWTELPGTYNDDQVINWNQYLMFVDRFTASTANNNQAPNYIYKMSENPTKLITPLRNTNEHIIPVQLTRSKVWGYYTEQEVLEDTLRQIVDTCLMNADVEMYLENTSDIYYYTLDRSRNSEEDAKFLALSRLQNDGARYVEFSEYFLPVNEPFNYGAMTRFDSIDVVLPASAPQGVDGKHYGKYDNGDYMAYVPIIWTFGNLDVNKRLNWDNDHKHNSYGSPIWQTGVGKVELMGQPKLERQDGKDGSTNWNEIVGNDTIPCSIFMITDLTAHGFLPNPEVSNIKYEPYMFRVWVMSDTTYLRKFEWVDGDPDDIYQRPGTHFEGRGTIPANEPFLVWEEFIDDNTTNISYDGSRPNVTIFHKSKIAEWETDTTGDVHFVTPQEMNMLFAAEDSLTSKHLSIIVRFYYRSTGEGLYQNQNNNQNGMLLMASRAGGANGFYGVEGEGDPDPDIPTFIKGVYISSSHGEIVSTTYYNLQGMQSSQPFQGINIIVTRYSDGTYSTQKVLRR